MGIPNYLICLLRNLYAGQEATIRTGHGTTDWFQFGKAVYCHPDYLIICRVHHEKCWAGLKHKPESSRRNVNNLRYADDTILLAEGEV